jgi:site-specific recombinase XerD
MKNGAGIEEKFSNFWQDPAGAPSKVRPPEPLANVGLLGWFSEHQDRRGVSPISINKRELYLRAFDRWLAGRSYFEVERDDVERFLDSRGVTAKTRYDSLSHIHCFYRWAQDADLTSSDPTQRIVRPKLPPTTLRMVDTAQLDQALKGATPKQRCWIVLAALQGLRVQEIAGLRVGDVEETQGLLRVAHAKGGNERMLPLHPEVLKALKALPLPRQGWIFNRPMGGKFTAHHLSFQLNRALRELGVGATARELRHWFGAHLYAETRDLLRVQQVMGLADLKSATQYIISNHEKEGITNG